MCVYVLQDIAGCWLEDADAAALAAEAAANLSPWNFFDPVTGAWGSRSVGGRGGSVGGRGGGARRGMLRWDSVAACVVRQLGSSAQGREASRACTTASQAGDMAVAKPAGPPVGTGCDRSCGKNQIRACSHRRTVPGVRR